MRCRVLAVVLFLQSLGAVAAEGSGATASARVLQSAIAQSPLHGSELERLLLRRAPGGRLIDLKIAVDRYIDPHMDEALVRREIAALARSALGILPAEASAEQRVAAILRVLGEAGHWNDGCPFRYDAADPYGRQNPVSTLSSYLSRRLGNCVSMPILVAILGQEVGVDLRLAFAPEHLLVRFRGSRGDWVNVEATSFGYKADASYQREFGIPGRALENGIYLRALNDPETAGAVVMALMDHLKSQQQPLQRLQVGEIVLALDPGNVAAMIGMGAASLALIRERYMSRYPQPRLIPEEMRAGYLALSAANHYWIERAEALGWVQLPPLQATVREVRP